MTKPNKEQILKVAKLAHLNLDPARLEDHAQKLNGIFDMLQDLHKVSTDEVEPLCNITASSGGTLEMRQDRAFAAPGADTILEQAANSSYGYFTVPKVVR